MNSPFNDKAYAHCPGCLNEFSFLRYNGNATWTRNTQDRCIAGTFDSFSVVSVCVCSCLRVFYVCACVRVSGKTRDDKSIVTQLEYGDNQLKFAV